MDSPSENSGTGYAARKKKSLIIIALLMTGIVTLYALKKFNLIPQKRSQQQQQQQQQNQNAQAAEERVSTTVYKTSRVNFEDSLTVLGSVEGGTQVKLNFQREGRIAKFHYKEGDNVKKGSVIAELDGREDALKMEQAKLEYEQHKKLLEAGVIIQTRLDQAQLAYDQAKVEYNKNLLIAPISGLLTKIEHKEGEVVNPTKNVVLIFDTRQMVIKVGITENDINKLQMDLTASVNIDAIPDMTFEGIIRNIDPSIDEVLRMMTAQIVVENPEGLILPGMFARSKIAVFKQDNALVLPSKGLQKNDEGYSVFIVGEGNTVAVRKIEVEYLSLDYAVVSTGLNEGDLVVIDKLDKMKEGTVVEILNVEEYATHTPGANGGGAAAGAGTTPGTE